MKRMMFGVLMLFAGGLAAGATYADENLTGVANERQDLMKEMAGAIEPMAAMVRGIQPYDADRDRNWLNDRLLGGDALLPFPDAA